MLKLEKKLSTLARDCGFKRASEKGYNPHSELIQQLQKDTKGAKPLAEYLLYDYCDDTSGVFFNKGSVSCFFEIEPLVGSNDSIEKNLTLFFNEELPSDSHLQFLVVASNDISDVVRRWEEPRKHGGREITKITAYRRWFIEKLARDFTSANDGRMPRNYRTFICCSIKDKGERSLNELLKFQRKLHNKLKAEKFFPRICRSQDLIGISRQILQMSQDKHDVSPYDMLNSLSNQILETPYPSTVEEDGIKNHKTGMVSRVLYPQEVPSSFSLSEMVKLLGGDDKAIPARFVISYTIANTLGAKGRSSLLAQGDRSIAAAGRSYTKDDLVAQEEAREWVGIKARVKKGEVFLEDSMLVMITAPEEDIDIAEESLRSLYNAEDWKLTLCKRVQRICSLSLLPMMPSLYWQALKFFRLTRNALSGDVVAKLPIQGEWRGVPTSGNLLMGKRGQLFTFNPFYRIGGGGNYNATIMAPPGSGKSYFLEDMTQSAVAMDTAVFVMDIGGSYKNICKAMGGEMVRFNSENKISLNPFATLSNSGAVYAKALKLMKAGHKDQDIAEITDLSLEKIEALRFGKSGAGSDAKETDGIELLEISRKDKNGNSKTHFVTKDSVVYAKAMVAAMCGVNNQGRQEALIERAIIDGIRQHGNELDITKLADVMEGLQDKHGNAISESMAMADSLYPYTEGGIHGRFFAAGESASFKEMLTVFELEELVNDEPLLSVVLQVILMQITMQFLCGDRTRRFMLIVDEAWMILDYAASFLERFARTVRKYGGSLIVCTQDLSSFNNDCGTRKSQAAVLECSTWKLILQQTKVGVESFAKSPAYQDYLGLISSLRKCSANKFSEILINTDGATVVGRLVTDPYSTAMFSTEDKDYAYLSKAEKAGKQIGEAVLELSKKYGSLPDLEELLGKSHV